LGKPTKHRSGLLFIARQGNGTVDLAITTAPENSAGVWHKILGKGHNMNNKAPPQQATGNAAKENQRRAMVNATGEEFKEPPDCQQPAS
jgi:hypothetical protein